MKIKIQESKTYGTQKNQFWEGSLYQYNPISGKMKNSNKQHNLHLKYLGKEEQTKPNISRRKEIINIMLEINNVEKDKDWEDKWNQKFYSSQNLKWKTSYSWHCRNTKDHDRLLWANVYQ